MKNDKHPLVIFDLDGTLSDTQEGIKVSVRYATDILRQSNPSIPQLTEADLNEFIGPPVYDQLRKIGCTDSEAKEGLRLYRVRYSQPKKTEDTPGMFLSRAFPEGKKLLELVSKKYPDWIKTTGTSKPEPWAHVILDKLGLTQLLSSIPHDNGDEKGFQNNGVFGASFGEDRANKESVLNYVLNNVANYFSPDSKWQDVLNPVLVGDRFHDVCGAKKVGIPVVGVKWGYAVEGELEGKLDYPAADLIAKTPEEALSAIEKIIQAN
ncbi:MAG: HAD hydrolase-like protein, partial [Candidatus Ancillula sp.]|jgi:phosphoglycolate phosphatase|nr:HAD hydrolase-like protein [Candidatus Ancillula sp.]